MALHQGMESEGEGRTDGLVIHDGEPFWNIAGGGRMRSDFADLVIEQAIVHAIPRRMKSGPMPAKVQLSDAVCGLTHTVRAELQLKLSDVLVNRGREVVVDPELKAVLPDQVRAYLEGRSDLVETSKEIAQLLHTSQPGTSSDGLLLVAAAKLDGFKTLLMVKLERETGVQATEIVTDEGLRTFDVQYFANLLLTEASRVYKIALFSVAGLSEDPMEGWAADKQMTGKALAKFFREKFLGCQLKNEPREVTLRFHDAAVEWINSRFSDADTRIAYLMALLVELQSPTPVLDPDAFIKTHLQPPHRDDFAEFLRENELPEQTFDKDLELVEPKLRKMRVEFDNGAFLVSPLEAVDHGTVQFADLQDGRMRLTVTGVMTSTRSFGQGKARRSGDRPTGEAAQAESVFDDSAADRH
ncbi:nucleoid-associated protein [Streptomyces sp. NPDC007088]|uniref:nucleoid-associated protein n=1 Tax=Streptomyces sp. NPDC007088 TaxID=3364773 RepID=UPI0036BE3E0D